MEKQPNYKTKITRILALTGWSQDHLSDLLEVTPRSFRKWLKNKRIPGEPHAAILDHLYATIVLPHQNSINCAATEAERNLLKSRLHNLPTSCPK